jgi:hypothetical protein
MLQKLNRRNSMAIRGRTLIKRYPLPLCRRTINVSAPTADNPFANSTTSYTFLRLEAEACTLQNVSGNKMQELPEGVRTEQMFTLYTNTGVFGSFDNTDVLADAVFIPDSWFEMGGYVPPNSGGWFRVVQELPRGNGVVQHTECVIVKDKNLLSNEEIIQYPDTTLLGANTPTKVSITNGSWITDWLGENV